MAVAMVGVFQMAKRNRSKGTKKPPQMPGDDHGIDRTTAIMTAADFNENLRAADIIACAYGERQDGQFHVTPAVMLVARNPEPLTKAFIQFKAWMDATGPDALNVEVLYSESGYYISFGPEYRHAMWRTVGLDQFSNPMYWGITYIKTIDTRHEFLERLASYSRHPVAPVLLEGTEYTGDQLGRTVDATALRPIPGCPQLTLLHLPIYKNNSEVPRFSGLISVTNPNPNNFSSEEEFGKIQRSPETVAASREKHLSSLMPITSHMLRAFGPLRTQVDSIVTECGVERWQVEQAIVNQRLWSLMTPQQRARAQNANDRSETLAHFMELDNPDWNTIGSDRSSILGQILRDARFLLKRIGANAPTTFPECQEVLRGLGYLKQAVS